RAGARAILEPLVVRMTAERDATDRPTLLAANLLAGVLHELGDLEPAERLYRTAFERLVATKGEDHPESLTVLNNLMLVQYSRGERTAMLPTLERLLAARRRVLGDDHPDTIGALNNVAGIEVGLGRFQDAAAHYREAADRILAREGDKHPAYAAILSNLATAEREAGEFAPALEHADRALALRRERLGNGHDATLLVQVLAADVRRLLGRLPEALAMFEEARQLAGAASPPQLANLYRCELGIGRTLTGLQRWEDAEAALQRCRATFAAAEKAASVKGQLSSPDKDLEHLAKARTAASASGK
ncbi:MAG: tetratricopeptide repeat protein, partial [Planctomycetes bacterium]|nr:tetratricopeptide repeat protein [Planctomycetota bacterium]